ncbi:MAG: type II toxin-antitoxin system HicB family antitoxin [Bacteroidota bacterium]|nr:type II toxin-antitoxin system HicB family antitoxin [Bacteroidota bacterium]
MARKFTAIIEKDEEGWLVSEVVELQGCHTQARTMDALIARTKEAIAAYLEIEEPVEVATEFIGMQQIEM